MATISVECEYLRTKCWTTIRLDVKLDVGVFQRLPDISGGGGPNGEIIDALAVAKEKKLPWTLYRPPRESTLPL